MDVFDILTTHKEKDINILSMSYLCLCRSGIHITPEEFGEMPLLTVSELITSIDDINTIEKSKR